MKRTRHGQHGFTIIELLIVVAVIGILAAIAIPQFTLYRVRAYNSNASSDIMTLRSEMEYYYAENLSYP